MNPETFVFIGRSGCGKGTQAALLQAELEKRDPGKKIHYIETGANFRQFIKGEKYSNKLADEIYKKGNRQPDFLAIWMWAHIILDKLEGPEHIVFDGTPRSLPEAEALTTAMSFYGRTEVHVINLDVSREWSRDRLMSRGRFDDKDEEEIKKRLDWFEKDTYPAIAYFGSHPPYRLHTIHAERPITEVHADIMSSIGWN